MTSRQISEQIDAIRSATAKASASKDSAAAFLIDAGILEKEASGYHSGHTKVKSKKSPQEANGFSGSH